MAEVHVIKRKAKSGANCAFVTYVSAASAERAVEAMHQAADPALTQSKLAVRYADDSSTNDRSRDAPSNPPPAHYPPPRRGVNCNLHPRHFAKLHPLRSEPKRC